MSSQKLFEDFSKMASGAFSTADSFRGEAETWVKTLAQKMFHDMHLVTQEDLDVLKQRIASLEAEVAALKKPTE
jgi:BMFP domain-containing protein YqiC